MKKKKSKGKKIVYDLLFLIALSVFLFSAYQLGTIYLQNYKENKETKGLQEISKVPENPEKEEFTVDWDALKKKNDQIIAWIRIPDTDISYPIVQGEDNDYYLTHTFEKKENYAGAIFMDAAAHADFSDLNTIIYGHNVKHGTMFADMEKFKDQTFFEEHPYVYIFTPEQNYRCEVFSMYSTTADSDSYAISYGSDEDYLAYATMVKEKSDFAREVVLKASDHMVSLSTCSYERDGQPSDMRYLLHAKMVKWDGAYKK